MFMYGYMHVLEYFSKINKYMYIQNSDPILIDFYMVSV